MNQDKIERGKTIVDELSSILGGLSDSEVRELLGSGAMDKLLKAILDPSTANEYPRMADFLLANKWRASVLALLRHAITVNYSFKGVKSGQVRYVSPDYHQWFDDGVMFLEGKERFSGLIGLYRNDELRYAIAAREIKGGEQVGAGDLEFATIADLSKRVSKIPREQSADVDKPLRQLTGLLSRKRNDESEYQDLLAEYPWTLGLRYAVVERHSRLDNTNVPDFTGIRIRDKCRDIIEIKPPFMRVFRRDGHFTSEFNEAWNQAERYLRFVSEEKDYLRRKGLNFQNPRCYLLLGFNIPAEWLKEIRAKEQFNPAIQVRTYNDLIAFIENTIKFVRNQVAGMSIKAK